MKSFLLLLCLSFSITCMAQRIYVSPNGTASASGSSWSEALNMDAALKQAMSGMEIWVREGIYKPNATAGRKATFVFPAGVKVYGGFAGTESSLTDRQLGTFSVLSGEIGKPDVTADNAYTVVTLKSEGQDITTLDGFMISGGNSRNFREGLTTGSAGGGLYIMAGKDNMSSHMITNCIFEKNMAHNGGAVLVDSGRPSFINCVFRANKADFNGGAVYNKGTASLASPIFRDCTFEANSSNSGAGMTNNGTNGESSPLLIGCDFINNTSLLNGAAIYNIFNDNGETQTILEDCNFVGNDSILGDDVSDNGVSKAIAAKAKQNGGGSLRPTTVRK
ncbi:hypothetical protein FUA23_16040 [Neolewinella aurantiaca]|uniref:Right handed beta helix domain-containing protein n=1 Tax=Neolewinella aurantiaca TaxID=2602767 RepID=A0A5C7FQ80_9BACT|nr:hypothetical protein [Neolewinella aurantiaca]TXF88150.1 hypothetical protein FUA23_16040 [Neolewinella aurantiaca]